MALFLTNCKHISLKQYQGLKTRPKLFGTYTNPDGAVETEVPEPEAVPFGATWQQTGIRDVLQGVDQTKLIPILTTSPAGSIARIEVLEAGEASDDANDTALLTLVANLSTRVAALEGA